MVTLIGIVQSCGGAQSQRLLIADPEILSNYKAQQFVD